MATDAKTHAGYPVSQEASTIEEIITRLAV